MGRFSPHAFVYLQITLHVLSNWCNLTNWNIFWAVYFLVINACKYRLVKPFSSSHTKASAQPKFLGTPMLTSPFSIHSSAAPTRCQEQFLCSWITHALPKGFCLILDIQGEHRDTNGKRGFSLIQMNTLNSSVSTVSKLNETYSFSFPDRQTQMVGQWPEASNCYPRVSFPSLHAYCYQINVGIYRFRQLTNDKDTLHRRWW